MGNYTLKTIAVVTTLLVCAFNVHAYGEQEKIQCKSSFSGSWSTYDIQLVSSLEGFTPKTHGSDSWNRYGSYRCVQGEKTGFFHVEKIDGRWWLVDPEGYANIQRAVNSLPVGNLAHDYGVCAALGYNAAGNFISSESQTKSAYNDVYYNTWGYTRRCNFYSLYKQARHKYYPDTPTKCRNNDTYIFALDPLFGHFCDSLAAQNIKQYATEKNLVGWFTDNEVPFSNNQLQYLVRDLPESDPCRVIALEWAAQHGLSEADCKNASAKLTEDLKKQFSGYIAEAYYKAVHDAIRKVDTNHMIIGSRLHGTPRGNLYIVRASHKYMDVTSVNFYDRFNPNAQIAKEEWTIDHPCLVTEFYVKDIHRQSGTQSGAGWYVDNQADRGRWYQNTCLELLASGCYVGWHYFRYMDDDDGSNKGIVNISEQEYKEMSAYMRELNEQVYALADYFDNKQRDTLPIGNTTLTLFPTQDNATTETYEVCFARKEADKKFAIIQFALPSNKGTVVHAELQLHCTSADQQVHNLMLSVLSDMSDTKNVNNRIASFVDTVKTENLHLDITSYVRDHPDGTLTLKLHALTATNTSLFYTSLKGSQRAQPKLVITYQSDDPADLSAVSQYRGDKAYYSLMGQKIGYDLTLLPHGMYIHNGEKIIK